MSELPLSDTSQAAVSEEPIVTSLPPRLPLKNPLMKFRANHNVFSSPSDKIMSPASKQLAMHRQRIVGRVKGVQLASQFAQVAREQENVEQNASSVQDIAKTIPDKTVDVATEASEPEHNTTSEEELEDTDAQVESDLQADQTEQDFDAAMEMEEPVITAVPRKPLASSLMRLRNGPNPNMFSSPSDAIMSPASRQLHQKRHRLLQKAKGTNLTSRFSQLAQQE